MSIWIFVSAFVLGFALGHTLGIFSLLIRHGFVDWHLVGRIILSTTPKLFFFSFGCAFIWAWIIFLLFPALISGQGIRGHSFWGMRRFVGWEEIVKVKKFSLFGLPYLRIFSATDGKVTWLPLFQSQMVEFRNEIRKFAPSNSPLLAHLN
jgi:hypothetical protein